MKSILARILLFSALPSLVLASTPDEYFEKAQEAAQQIKLITDKMLEMEANGELDPENKPDQLGTLKSDLAAYQDNLQMASDGGHTIASYLLGNFRAPFVPSKAGLKETCRLYQKASDQGLLAAAVGYHYLCDTSYERFEPQDAEQLKYMQVLERLLQQPDTHGDDYPLPAKRSLCFPGAEDSLPQQGIMAAMQAHSGAMMLTEDQYRAEGNYILAMTRMNKQGRPEQQNIAYLDKAEALGCKDLHGLNAMMRAAAKASGT